jgi:mannose-6-phosphate isomerase-like protein (cupin superfamily)
MAEPCRQRIITTHDQKTGQSIFDTSISASVPRIPYPGDLATLETHYVAEDFPVDLSGDKDMTTYQRYLAAPPGVYISNGTLVRYLDLNPGASSPMHRTLSLDIGVVIDGSMKVELDSGETKVLKKGDVIVQRATMHAWHNASDTEPVRMVFFIQPTAPLEVAGQALHDEYRV